MSSEPPRRRRSEPPSSRRSSSGPSLLPTIALGIGVVVAGLGIGAFLSAMQNRAASTTTATTTTSGLPVVTPVARPTRGPVAIATLVAHPTDTPSPKVTATPRPTATPKAVAAVTTTPKPAAETPKPASTPFPAVIAAKPTEPPTTAPTPRPIATPRPPTPRPTLPPTPPPPPKATPLPPLPGIETQAQTTVRRYLDALIAGNENAAYAALGASPGDPNARLSEEAFIDRGTRITSMRTTSAYATGATVEVEMRSSRGSYYGTYHVTSSGGGLVIDQHDYIKI